MRPAQAVAIGVILGIPVLTRSVRTLLAVAGIVIGGTMTASTLTGRRLSDGLHRRRDEVEAWLSLGATPRQAVRDIARDAVFEALVPALDQTRTVGLVTLPGAFIGALLAGASATTAARFQIVVLVGLLCAEALTATILAWLLGAPATLPAPRSNRRPGRSARSGSVDGSVELRSPDERAGTVEVPPFAVVDGDPAGVHRPSEHARSACASGLTPSVA